MKGQFKQVIKQLKISLIPLSMLIILLGLNQFIFERSPTVVATEPLQQFNLDSQLINRTFAITPYSRQTFLYKDNITLAIKIYCQQDDGSKRGRPKERKGMSSRNHNILQHMSL